MNDRKIAAMHREYGTADRTCKGCLHLIRYDSWAGRHYFKCKAYGESNSEATDWRVSYTACGLYNQPIKGLYPLIERMKHQKKTVEEGPIDGQITMEELIKQTEEAR